MKKVSLLDALKPSLDRTPDPALVAVNAALRQGRPLLLELPSPRQEAPAVIKRLIQHAVEHDARVYVVCRSWSRLQELYRDPKTLGIAGGIPSIARIGDALDVMPDAMVLFTTLDLFCQRLFLYGETEIPHNALLFLEDSDALPSLVRQAGGRSIDLPRIEAIAEALEQLPEAGTDAERLRGEGTRFFAELVKHRERTKSPSFEPLADLPWFDLVDALETARARFSSEARRILADPAGDVDAATFWNELTATAARCRSLLESACETRSSARARYLAPAEGGGVVLCEAPIELGKDLDRLLYKRAWCLVLSGPALYVGKSAEFIRGELDLPVRALEHQAFPSLTAHRPVLLVPNELPPVGSAEWPVAVCRLWERLRYTVQAPACAVASGRKTFRLLEQTIADHGGGAIPGQEAHLCLRWGPLDVTDEMLKSSCLFLDRLPFPGLLDPISEAIKSQRESWFATYALPRAVLTFRSLVARWLEQSDAPRYLLVADNRLTDSPWSRHFTDGLGLRIERDVRVLETRPVPGPLTRAIASLPTRRARKS